MPDSRLYDIASSILTELADGLDGEAITVPVHRYVHSGEVAFDLVEEECAEQLVVSFAGILQGPGDDAGFLPGTVVKCAVPLVAQYDVYLLRCVPTLNEDNAQGPSAAELDSAAMTILYDSMTLPAVAIAKQLAGELTDQGCSLVGIGSVLPVGPVGGVGGTTLTLFVSLV